MIEGEFWMVEDMASNQGRIHIESETTLSQSPKQPGDSIVTSTAEGLVLRRL